MLLIQELLADKYNSNTFDQLIKTIAVLKIQYKKEVEEKKVIPTDEYSFSEFDMPDYSCIIAGLLFDFIENPDSVDTIDKIMAYLEEVRRDII